MREGEGSGVRGGREEAEIFNNKKIKINPNNPSLYEETKPQEKGLNSEMTCGDKHTVSANSPASE